MAQVVALMRGTPGALVVMALAALVVYAVHAAATQAAILWCSFVDEEKCLISLVPLFMFSPVPIAFMYWLERKRTPSASAGPADQVAL